MKDREWLAALLPAILRRRCSGPTAGHQGEDAADPAAVQEADVEVEEEESDEDEWSVRECTL